MSKKKQYRIPNTETPNPLRDAFEEWYEEEVRPVEAKRMTDAFAGCEDDTSAQLLDAWEGFLDNELKELHWQDYQVAVANTLNQSEAVIQQLELDLSRLSHDIHESAIDVFKHFADDQVAISVFFLSYAGKSQRDMAKILKCSPGKVNGRVKKLEDMGFRVKKQGIKETIKPRQIAGTINPTDEIDDEWD